MKVDNIIHIFWVALLYKIYGLASCGEFSGMKHVGFPVR